MCVLEKTNREIWIARKILKNLFNSANKSTEKKTHIKRAIVWRWRAKRIFHRWQRAAQHSLSERKWWKKVTQKFHSSFLIILPRLFPNHRQVSRWWNKHKAAAHFYFYFYTQWSNQLNQLQRTPHIQRMSGSFQTFFSWKNVCCILVALFLPRPGPNNMLTKWTIYTHWKRNVASLENCAFFVLDGRFCEWHEHKNFHIIFFYNSHLPSEN